VYGICSPYTQDLTDIAYILATHWELYISPIINDWNDFNDRGDEYEIPPQAQARLNSIFRQTIGASVQLLYPRLIDSETWISQVSPEDRNIRFSRADRNTVLQSRKESALSQDGDDTLNVTRLPLIARYLLVASYLASFNPTTMDVRILSQVRDPTKKLRKIGVRKAQPGVALKVRSRLFLPELCLTLVRLPSDWTPPFRAGNVQLRQTLGDLWCSSGGFWTRREATLGKFPNSPWGVQRSRGDARSISSPGLSLLFFFGGVLIGYLLTDRELSDSPASGTNESARQIRNAGFVPVYYLNGAGLRNK